MSFCGGLGENPEEGITPESIRKADEYVKRIMDRKKSGWISTDRRLPTQADASEDNMVLICNVDYKYQGVMKFSEVDSDMITHWQSLPALPEKED